MVALKLASAHSVLTSWATHGRSSSRDTRPPDCARGDITQGLPDDPAARADELQRRREAVLARDSAIRALALDHEVVAVLLVERTLLAVARRQRRYPDLLSLVLRARYGHGCERLDTLWDVRQAHYAGTLPVRVGAPGLGVRPGRSAHTTASRAIRAFVGLLAERLTSAP